MGSRCGRAFQDAIVVGIVTDGVDGGARRDESTHAPENRQNSVQDGWGPVELLREDTKDFRLDGFGIEKLALAGFRQLEDRSRHATKHQRRHDHVGVEDDADHFLVARFVARSSWTRRSMSGSRMPWRAAFDWP